MYYQSPSNLSVSQIRQKYLTGNSSSAIGADYMSPTHSNTAAGGIGLSTALGTSPQTRSFESSYNMPIEDIYKKKAIRMEIEVSELRKELDQLRASNSQLRSEGIIANKQIQQAAFDLEKQRTIERARDGLLRDVHNLETKNRLLVQENDVLNEKYSNLLEVHNSIISGSKQSTNGTSNEQQQQEQQNFRLTHSPYGNRSAPHLPLKEQFRDRNEEFLALTAQAESNKLLMHEGYASLKGRLMRNQTDSSIESDSKESWKQYAEDLQEIFDRVFRLSQSQGEIHAQIVTNLQAKYRDVQQKLEDAVNPLLQQHAAMYSQDKHPTVFFGNTLGQQQQSQGQIGDDQQMINALQGNNNNNGEENWSQNEYSNSLAAATALFGSQAPNASGATTTTATKKKKKTTPAKKKRDQQQQSATTTTANPAAVPTTAPAVAPALNQSTSAQGRTVTRSQQQIPQQSVQGSNRLIPPVVVVSGAAVGTSQVGSNVNPLNNSRLSNNPGITTTTTNNASNNGVGRRPNSAMNASSSQQNIPKPTSTTPINASRPPALMESRQNSRVNLSQIQSANATQIPNRVTSPNTLTVPPTIQVSRPVY